MSDISKRVTSWRGVLENLTFLQLVNKLFAFYSTPKFYYSVDATPPLHPNLDTWIQFTQTDTDTKINSIKNKEQNIWR